MPMTQTPAPQRASTLASTTPSESDTPTSDEPSVHNVRSIALLLIALLALVFMIRWTADVLIPIAIAMMCSYAMTPLVDALERHRMPRALGAGVVVLGLIGTLGWTAFSLSDDAVAMVEQLPVAAKKIRTILKPTAAKPSTLDSVQAAANELATAAQAPASAQAGLPAAAASAPRPAAKAAPVAVTRVVLEKPKFDLGDYLLTGSIGVLKLAAQFFTIMFLTYFLLAAGDIFRRKMVKLMSGGLRQKRLTVEAMNDISKQVQTYLLVQVAASALVGVLVGLAFWALGLEYAVVWGVASAVLHMVPYLGPAVTTVAASLAAFLQFGDLASAAKVAGASLVINTVVGNLIVPWLTSKTSSLNPVAVFVGVLAWGWLWGVPGLLLGIPILMVIKTVCEHIDDLQPVAELLGN